MLINGAKGIGTGWSTEVRKLSESHRGVSERETLICLCGQIPPFNPHDVVANVRRALNGEELQRLAPWWRSFRGHVSVVKGSAKCSALSASAAAQSFTTRGTCVRTGEKTIVIRELPIGCWTQVRATARAHLRCGANESQPSSLRSTRTCLISVSRTRSSF